MAGKVYITEYPEPAARPAGLEPALATQTISTSGSSGQSSAFNAETRLVRVHAATTVSVLFGTNPTATTDSPRMVAGQTEYFRLAGNTTQLKMAAIDNT